MRLAEHQGRLTEWEELLDELQPRQVAVLQAYRRLHPWPEDAEERRWAIGTAAICSAISVSGKGVDPDDLLKMVRPKRKRKKERGWISPNAAAAIANEISRGA